jgi:hypothetical protein
MAPKLDINMYIALLKNASKRTAAMCIYCGNENVAATDPWICAFCENAIYAGVAEAALKNKALMKGLESINGYVENNDYKSAADGYNAIIEKNGMPQYLYAAALVNIAYSNDDVAKIRYDRHGFMEENAELRIEASKLMSNAKLLLNRAIFRVASMSGTSMTPDLAFTAFMCAIKSGNLRAARTYSDYLKGVQHLSDYAGMVMSAELGNFDDLYLYANKLLGNKTFVPGAAYYIAWGLFKQRRYNESSKLLEKLLPVAGSRSAAALLKDIERAKSLP